MPAFRSRNIQGFAKTLKTASFDAVHLKATSFARTLGIVTASGGSQDATVSTLPQAKITGTLGTLAVNTGLEAPTNLAFVT